MNQKLLQVIDANYNRAKEAVRVAEDIARFYFKDARLTARFKRARHDLTKILLGFKVPYQKLVKARNSEKDVGAKSLIRDKSRVGWQDLLSSNLKRAEEATRVLEEFSKMIEPSKTRSFQKIRFRLYELEKESIRKF
ncbi:MAG: thiamine-phosphate pyrophosphorylase [Candidatus Omnitrophica bacterium]|nr:thiamine-phosphate pyrophosphorylase [Candidatus Omnitrophota bacterium]